ncbi:hypothetical protein N9Y67_02705 [Pseudomonadota bacterium]|nr:hypothetical protein [Pseudomonadota bacterium]
MKLISLTFLLLAGGTASAASTTYADRTAFETASGALTTETFNSFTSEEAFHTTPLGAGDFTLSMTGNPVTRGRNSIDIPPVRYSSINVDGTNVANVLTKPGANLILTFDDSIFAFGADFAGFNDESLRTNILISGITYSPATNGDFWGITSDTAFNSVEFVSIQNDGFGMDNVSYTPISAVSAVPIPAAAFLFGPALLGFMGLRRKAKNSIA